MAKISSCPNYFIMFLLSAISGIAILCLPGCIAPSADNPDDPDNTSERSAEIADALNKLSMPPSTTTPPVVLTPVTGHMNLLVAINNAIAHSDRIALLRAAVDIAAQQKFVARDLRDPELRLSHETGLSSGTRAYLSTNLTPRSSSANAVGNNLALRLFPPNPWALSARVSGATANYYADLAYLRHEEWLITIEICRLFAEIQYLENDVQLIDQLTGVYKDTQDILEESMRQGQSTLQDLMTASRRYLRALSERNNVIHLYEEAHRQLAELTAIPADQIKLVFDENMPKPIDSVLMDMNFLENEAIQNRPDLTALFWRTEASKAKYKEACAERKPWLEFIQFSYATGSQSEDTDEFDIFTGSTATTRDDVDDDEWRVDIAISVPIISWLNHSTTASLSEHELAKMEESALLKRIHRKISSALSTMKSIEESQKQYETESTPIIQQMQNVLTSLEDENVLSPDQIARIKEEILETQRLKLKAEYDHLSAFLTLEEALGKQITELGSEAR